MRAKFVCLLILLGAGGWTMPLGAAVLVSFSDSDHYTDIGRYSLDSQHKLTEIEQHLKRLGDRYLPSQQMLKIEVLDIDLAGEDRPLGRYGFDVRIVKGTADWPSIKLRYTLESQGKTLATREETVLDMNYLMRGAINYSGESLQYEKRMLDDWFRTRFVERKPAQ